MQFFLFILKTQITNNQYWTDSNIYIVHIGFDQYE